ncbi:MAG: hypothetical protein GX492_11265 [Firmicutes bacterium]|nr:hypothetical protein [Bacillota bacterium]
MRRLLLATLVAVVAVVIAAVLPPTLSCTCGAGTGAGVAETDPQGQATCRAAEREPARNVILFIGDGMGQGQVHAGKLAKGRPLAMESMPVRTTVATLSFGGNITDSAAAATALATGHKTVNGFLGVLPDGTPVRTILEAARNAGWLVGLVSTCPITDATPAAFAVHVESRHEKRTIAAALIEAKIDLVMGGGAADFLPTLFVKDEPPVELARKAGYTVLQDRKGFDEASSLPLLGLFSMTNVEWEKDRDPRREPSLAEMTDKAVRLLSSPGRRFLLVVEGGRIDHACHNNDAEALRGEMAAFDDAIARGLGFARERKDTLIVVTADHETGGLAVDADGKLKFGTDGHTDAEVPLFAEGPGQEMFAGQLDNTDVPKIIAAAAGLALEPETVAKAATGPTETAPQATVAATPAAEQPTVPEQATAPVYGAHQAAPGVGAAESPATPQESAAAQAQAQAPAQGLPDEPEQAGVETPRNADADAPTDSQEQDAKLADEAASSLAQQTTTETPTETPAAAEELAMKQHAIPAPMRLTVMTYNIHSGVGADLKLDLDRIADLIRDQGADIVGLCEVDQGTRRSGGVDQARYIAERLGYYYAYGPNFMYDGGAFGNAVLSRYPIVSSTNHPLPNIHFNEPRGLLEAQVDTGGGILNVFVTHLDVEYADSRLAQARAVIEISSKAAGPKIVMGDLNASPTGSPEIAVLLRHFNDTQQVYRVLVDSAELVKEGLFARDYLKGGYTYDAYDPARRIDYILTSFDIKVPAAAGTARVPRTLASDHLPYAATIELPWLARARGDAPGTLASRAAAAAAEAPAGEAEARHLVAIFTSEANRAWYDDMRWDYEDDTAALVEVVQALGQFLGFEWIIVSGDNLERLPAIAESRATVLVLSNARRMSPAQAQAVRDFLACGGRVLATGQTSLKTEDERPGGFHGFGLADVLGVAFAGWQGVAPLHGAIVPPTSYGRGAGSGDGGMPQAGAPDAAPCRASGAPRTCGTHGTAETAQHCGPADDLSHGATLRSLWKGIEAPIRLPRPQGVVVTCLPGAVALGTWASADQADTGDLANANRDAQPTHPDPFNVAVATTGRALYVGADILSRDMLSDQMVRSFAENAIRCLLGL